MHASMLSRLLRAAQTALARRNTMAEEEGTESGFTLIELMVVLLIMAILMAIAIPTFLGVKGSAQDRSAQSDLSNALISSKAFYSGGGSYSGSVAMVAALNSAEPELTFQAGGTSSVAHTIEVDVAADNQTILLVDWSQSGNCWALEDNNSGNPEGAGFGAAPTGDRYLEWYSGTGGIGPCTTTIAEGANAGDWSATYPSIPLASF